MGASRPAAQTKEGEQVLLDKHREEGSSYVVIVHVCGDLSAFTTLFAVWWRVAFARLGGDFNVKDQVDAAPKGGE